METLNQCVENLRERGRVYCRSWAVYDTCRLEPGGPLIQLFAITLVSPTGQIKNHGTCDTLTSLPKHFHFVEKITNTKKLHSSF